MKTVETDVLVVGAGPAGASCALFLGKHGVSSIMLSRQRSVARTPRAHITNQRAMEALRDAGVERKLTAVASPGEYMGHTFWLRSMVGEELARVYAWGQDPSRKSDYLTASPCEMCDLPQSELEPVLVTEASWHGAHVRFDTELRSFTQDDEGVTALAHDLMSGEDFTIRAKYMVGADGSRGRIVDQLGIRMDGDFGSPSVINIFCEGDLSDVVAQRKASMYLCVHPTTDKWAGPTVFRMVRPWDRWVVMVLRTDSTAIENVPLEELKDHLRTVVGKDVDFNILDVSTWSINELVAEKYSVGRVFCMGDAVHRHSPGGGMGSNTCVQDAFNLAWKLALAVQGKAGQRLLETYNAERQPVGASFIKQANRIVQSLHPVVWNLMGGEPGTNRFEEDYRKLMGTADGRKALRQGLDAIQSIEGHGQGRELNRQYVSDAVIQDGSPPIDYARDEEIYYQASTRPGSPLPHAWIGKRYPAPLVSTQDVAGKTQFTLLTRYEDARWRDAASHASSEIGLNIRVVSIGPFCDFEDTYGRWEAVCEIEEDGCILVRPDLYVAWRSKSAPTDPSRALLDVMTRILSD